MMVQKERKTLFTSPLVINCSATAGQGWYSTPKSIEKQTSDNLLPRQPRAGKFKQNSFTEKVIEEIKYEPTPGLLIDHCSVPPKTLVDSDEDHKPMFYPSLEQAAVPHDQFDYQIASHADSRILSEVNPKVAHYTQRQALYAPPAPYYQHHNEHYHHHYHGS